jgi:hypothetical protein
MFFTSDNVAFEGLKGATLSGERSFRAALKCILTD